MRLPIAHSSDSFYNRHIGTASMTKYEGSAAVVNAVDLLRTVWNEMVRQFHDVPEDKRVDLYAAMMPAFLDITTTGIVFEEERATEGGWVYDDRKGEKGERK